MNKCVSFQINAFIVIRYIPRSEIAVSYGTSIFLFLRNLHTNFHNGYINLPPASKGSLLSISLLNAPTCFSMIAILTSMRWCFIVGLICISLMTSDTDIPQVSVGHHLCTLWKKAYSYSLPSFLKNN